MSSKNTSPMNAGTAATIAVGASVTTAAAAYFYHQRQTRRLEARLTEQRMAERRGRIRAEVQLRTLTKEMAGGGITGSSDISSSSGNTSSSSAGPDNLLKCIGKVVSPYTKRAGTPRQGQLAPSARGYIQLTIPTQMVEGMELYSHCWVTFAFHANTDMGSSKKTKIRPPRAPTGCKVGMLATRSPHRPNNLGLSLVKVDRVDSKQKRLYISALDLVNGTPVYDIKPVIPWDQCDDLSVPDWVKQEDALAKVQFTEEAKSSLEHCVKRGYLKPLYTMKNGGVEAAYRTLCEVLAQDPRSLKFRGSESNSADPYSLIFCKVLVTFAVENKEVGVKILHVKQAQEQLEGAFTADGVPLLGLGV